MAANVQSLDLPSVIAAVARVMRAQADEGGILLSADIAPGLPRVMADEKRLRQVLINLVTNAVKFKEREGSVSIAAHMTGGSIAITVTDTGIGIAPEDIDRAFEPFVQLEASLSRRFGGSGLGLHLARTLARAMGFKLTLDSEQGRGTTATLIIPADRQVAEETPHD
jgi:signal transduction histidine kinase